jgi:hypothetical protein
MTKRKARGGTTEKKRIVAVRKDNPTAVVLTVRARPRAGVGGLCTLAEALEAEPECCQEARASNLQAEKLFREMGCRRYTPLFFFLLFLCVSHILLNGKVFPHETLAFSPTFLTLFPTNLPSGPCFRLRRPCESPTFSTEIVVQCLRKSRVRAERRQLLAAPGWS